VSTYVYEAQQTRSDLTVAHTKPLEYYRHTYIVAG